jgi:cellulose biosynthesis protein BcsQ
MTIDILGGEKGGTGKTAFATNLAVCLAIAGQRVLLWDADPQRSAIDWYNARAARADFAALPQFTCRATTAALEPKERGVELFNGLRTHAKEFDHIVVDCAGAETPELYYALCAGHRLWTPMVPSIADLRTAEGIEALVAKVRDKGNRALRATVVLNQCSNRLDADSYVRRARELLAEKLKLMKVARTPVAHRRPVYAAFWDHLTVPELLLSKDRRQRQAAKKAGDEVWALFEEITGTPRPVEESRGKRRAA